MMNPGDQKIPLRFRPFSSVLVNFPRQLVWSVLVLDLLAQHPRAAPVPSVHIISGSTHQDTSVGGTGMTRTARDKLAPEPTLRYTLHGQDLILVCGDSTICHNHSTPTVTASNKNGNNSTNNNIGASNTGINLNNYTASTSSNILYGPQSNITWILPSGRAVLPDSVDKTTITTKESKQKTGRRNSDSSSKGGNDVLPAQCKLATLTITKANVADSGRYLCRSGDNSSIDVFDVKVVEPPPAPYQCHVVQREADSVERSHDLSIVCSSGYVNPNHFKFILVWQRPTSSALLDNETDDKIIETSRLVLAEGEQPSFRFNLASLPPDIMAAISSVGDVRPSSTSGKTIDGGNSQTGDIYGSLYVCAVHRILPSAQTCSAEIKVNTASLLGQPSQGVDTDGSDNNDDQPGVVVPVMAALAGVAAVAAVVVVLLLLLWRKRGGVVCRSMGEEDEGAPISPTSSVPSGRDNPAGPRVGLTLDNPGGSCVGLTLDNPGGSCVGLTPTGDSESCPSLAVNRDHQPSRDHTLTGESTRRDVLQRAPVLSERPHQLNRGTKSAEDFAPYIDMTFPRRHEEIGISDSRFEIFHPIPHRDSTESNGREDGTNDVTMDSLSISGEFDPTGDVHDANPLFLPFAVQSDHRSRNQNYGHQEVDVGCEKLSPLLENSYHFKRRQSCEHRTSVMYENTSTVEGFAAYMDMSFKRVQAETEVGGFQFHDIAQRDKTKGKDTECGTKDTSMINLPISTDGDPTKDANHASPHMHHSHAHNVETRGDQNDGHHKLYSGRDTLSPLLHNSLSLKRRPSCEHRTSVLYKNISKLDISEETLSPTKTLARTLSKDITPGRPCSGQTSANFSRTRHRWSLGPALISRNPTENESWDSGNPRARNQRSLSASTVEDEDWLNKWVWLETSPGLKYVDQEPLLERGPSPIPYIDDIQPSESQITLSPPTNVSAPHERDTAQEARTATHKSKEPNTKPIQNHDLHGSYLYQTRKDKFDKETPFSKADYYKFPCSKPKYETELKDGIKDQNVRSEKGEKCRTAFTQRENQPDDGMGTHEQRDSRHRRSRKNREPHGTKYGSFEQQEEERNKRNPRDPSYRQVSVQHPNLDPHSQDPRLCQRLARKPRSDVSNSLSSLQFLPRQAETPSSASATFSASSGDLRLESSTAEDIRYGWESPIHALSIVPPDLDVPPKLRKKTKSQSEFAKTLTTVNKPITGEHDYDFPRRLTGNVGSKTHELSKESDTYKKDEELNASESRIGPGERRENRKTRAKYKQETSVSPELQSTKTHGDVNAKKGVPYSKECVLHKKRERRHHEKRASLKTDGPRKTNEEHSQRNLYFPHLNHLDVKPLTSGALQDASMTSSKGVDADKLNIKGNTSEQMYHSRYGSHLGLHDTTTLLNYRSSSKESIEVDESSQYDWRYKDDRRGDNIRLESDSGERTLQLRPDNLPTPGRGETRRSRDEGERSQRSPRNVKNFESPAGAERYREGPLFVRCSKSSNYTHAKPDESLHNNEEREGCQEFHSHKHRDELYQRNKNSQATPNSNYKSSSLTEKEVDLDGSISESILETNAISHGDKHFPSRDTISNSKASASTNDTRAVFELPRYSESSPSLTGSTLHPDIYSNVTPEQNGSTHILSLTPRDRGKRYSIPLFYQSNTGSGRNRSKRYDMFSRYWRKGELLRPRVEGDFCIGHHQGYRLPSQTPNHFPSDLDPVSSSSGSKKAVISGPLKHTFGHDSSSPSEGKLEPCAGGGSSTNDNSISRQDRGSEARDSSDQSAKCPQQDISRSRGEEMPTSPSHSSDDGVTKSKSRKMLFQKHRHRPYITDV